MITDARHHRVPSANRIMEVRTFCFQSGNFHSWFLIEMCMVGKYGGKRRRFFIQLCLRVGLQSYKLSSSRWEILSRDNYYLGVPLFRLRVLEFEGHLRIRYRFLGVKTLGPMILKGNNVT